VSPRLLSVGTALATLPVLALAALLVPSPQGFGTHTQLGLGTCSFLAATGHPCPMCGATTTFTLLAHLDLAAGVVNQPFAALLYASTLAFAALALTELVDPRGRWAAVGGWVEEREAMLASTFLFVMGAGWIYKTAEMIR
jgi:Protein of unknown function (DUF2752)